MNAEFATALSKLQSELTTVKTNKTADMGKRKQDYASYDHVIDHVRPLLAKHGFSVTNTAGQAEDGSLVLRSRLIHSSGEEVVSELPLKAAGNPQALGSELSYMKRYSLSGLLGLASSSDDDDGGLASSHTNQSRSAPPRQRKPPPTDSDEATKRQRRLWAQVNATAKALGLEKSGGEDMLREMLADMFEKESTKTLTTQEDYELRHKLWALQAENADPETQNELAKMEPKKPRGDQ